MVIGERLKALREQRNMSQGDIEKRTGLLRVYVSRVENGHTVPAIETLEKFARALEIPIYQLFYDGENPPAPIVPVPQTDKGWGSSGRDVQTLHRFRSLITRMDQGEVKLLLFMAQKCRGGKSAALGCRSAGSLNGESIAASAPTPGSASSRSLRRVPPTRSPRSICRPARSPHPRSGILGLRRCSCSQPKCSGPLAP